MKKCNWCGEMKAYDQFYNHPNNTDGLYNHCRSCHLGYTANWARLHPDKKALYARRSYWRNPEKRRLATKKYNEINREIVIRKGRKWAHQRWLRCINGLGGKCACCGETCITMLEIDHVNGFGNKHRKKMGGSVGVYCDIIARNFPKDEFAVMCASCNQSKRRNVGDCEHGSSADLLMMAACP